MFAIGRQIDWTVTIACFRCHFVYFYFVNDLYIFGGLKTLFACIFLICLLFRNIKAKLVLWLVDAQSKYVGKLREIATSGFTAR